MTTATLMGNQTPAWETTLDAGSNPFSTAAIDLSATVNTTLEPWQEHVLHKGCSTENHKWTAKTVCISVPRQQGKSEILIARALAGLFIFGEKFIVISAHEVRTTMEIFRRMDSIISNSEFLMPYVKHIHRANGEQGFELHSGARIKFMSRSKNAGRGFTADVLLLDEAQELSADTWAAILPTITAAPNGQIWLFGTPPAPTANSEVFTSMRKEALEGAPLLYWAEWSADETDDFDDPAVWAKANPTLGMRVEPGTIAQFRSTMSEEAFAREILGIWLSGKRMAVIPADWWEPIGKVELQLDPDEAIWLAVDVAPDRTVTSVSLAQVLEDGKVALVLLERRTGVTWAADYIAGVVSRRNVQLVAVDSGGASATLIDPLKEREVPIVTLNTKDVTIACGRFYDAVLEQSIVHLNDPAINSAIGGAAKRTLLNAWAWTRKSNEDITPLVAITYALWATTQKTAAASQPKPKVAKISTSYHVLG